MRSVVACSAHRRRQQFLVDSEDEGVRVSRGVLWLGHQVIRKLTHPRIKLLAQLIDKYPHLHRAHNINVPAVILLHIVLIGVSIQLEVCPHVIMPNRVSVHIVVQDIASCSFEYELLNLS